jgi:hypothetical protein
VKRNRENFIKPANTSSGAEISKASAIKYEKNAGKLNARPVEASPPKTKQKQESDQYLKQKSFGLRLYNIKRKKPIIVLISKENIINVGKCKTEENILRPLLFHQN